MKNRTNENLFIIDREFFESRKQIGDGFIRELVEVFSTEAPKLIGEIKACDLRNFQDLAVYGHKLKGMCLNVGATRLSEIGRLIEENCLKRDAHGIETLISDIDLVFRETKHQMESIANTDAPNQHS